MPVSLFAMSVLGVPHFAAGIPGIVGDAVTQASWLGRDAEAVVLNFTDLAGGDYASRASTMGGYLRSYRFAATAGDVLRAKSDQRSFAAMLREVPPFIWRPVARATLAEIFRMRPEETTPEVALSEAQLERVRLVWLCEMVEKLDVVARWHPFRASVRRRQVLMAEVLPDLQEAIAAATQDPIRASWRRLVVGLERYVRATPEGYVLKDDALWNRFARVRE